MFHRFLCFTLFLFSFALTLSAENLVLKSDFLAVTVTGEGFVDSAVELRNGTDWLHHKGEYFALVAMENQQNVVVPEKVEWVSDGKQIRVTFKNGFWVVLNYESFPNYYTLEIDSVSSEDFLNLEFGRVTLKPDYASPEAFGFSSLILAINTDVVEYPGRASRLGARVWGEIGVKGAKAAFVGVPEKQMRGVMQGVTTMILEKQAADPEYYKIAPPVNRFGGGFAMDIPKNHGSYIITSTPIKAEEVEEWANHLGQFGVNQIDFHQGNPFRQGDFHFKDAAYPNGVADFRRMTDELKKHGMMAGLHTYSEFVVNGSKYLTPVPHKDLDVMNTYTLTEDLTAESKDVPVEESTENIEFVLAYTRRNSHYVRIDDELLEFTELGTNGFLKCKRGACGTVVAEHKKGAKVDHLSQYFFSYFCPNPKSDLFLEIARNTAKTYDEGGFSMIYLDALDGTSGILGEKRYLCWYYDALFVREILRNIKSEPPLLEYSTMHPSLWAARSRMGAWDSPSRGYLHFFKWHFQSNNQSAEKCYLPGQMGWFAVCPARKTTYARNFQCKTLFREDLDYLGSKILAHDAGLSYLDISLGQLVPAAWENGQILKTYDLLRRDHYFPAEVCEKVLDPEKHFRLMKDGEKYVMAEARYTSLATEKTDEAPSVVKVENPFRAQKPYIRIENRYALEAYDAENSEELLAFDETKPAQTITSRVVEAPYLNLTQKLGMGIWIYGDGQGQLLNIRVYSPYHLHTAFADHYAVLDHKGWKYFEFAEAENGKYGFKQWPSGRSGLYDELRSSVRYDNIEKIYVMVEGPTDGLKFRTLRAIPIVETELTDPAFELAGQKVTLKGSIPSGCYAEITAESDEILVKDPAGNVLGQLTAEGELPQIPTGESELKPVPSAPAARTLWTVGVYE